MSSDFSNIVFLFFLYFLQGIPLGLTGSLPFILGSRKISYSDQGTFSFAFYPFSLKLLWAPIVDSVYSKTIGRRKSWLVPMQYLIGFILIAFSDYVQNILEGASISSKDIYVLTFIFFVITFMAATQDIAVDGWALTILSNQNVTWASTCNSAGQSFGWFVGNVLFLIFQSNDFCNKYIRPLFGLAEQTYGLVTINKFMQFFGIAFIVTTTLILFFKKEKKHLDHHESYEDKLTLKETYKIVWRILNLKAIKKLMFILVTCKIAFALYSMAYLKLIEKGVPKEKLGLLAIPLTPIQVGLPILASRLTNGPKPLSYFIQAYPYRILASGLIVFWVYLTPLFKDNSTNDYPFYYFILCVFVNGFYSIFSTFMFVADMAFFTRISDKRVGGTFMTLLNTISNIGSSWPQTVVYFLADLLTSKKCVISPMNKVNISMLESIENNFCSSNVEVKKCAGFNGICEIVIDGYYILAFCCTIIGIIWYYLYKRNVYHLQSLNKIEWEIK